MGAVYAVKSRTDVAPVWSGNPVGFSRVVDSHQEFLAFYDPHRQLTVAHRTKNQVDWTFQKLDEIVALDAHNSAAIGIDTDGHLHLAANMHGVPLNYWRTKSSGDITSFERHDVMTGSDEKRVTYPRFFHDAEGQLYFKYRDGGSGNGVELVNVYVQGRWQRFLSNPLLDGEGLMNAYQTGPIRGPDGKFHLAWVWRDTPRVETNHDLSYAVSSDLKRWETADGQSLELPIVIEDACHVDRVRTREGMLNRIHMGFDSTQRIVLTYIKFDSDGDTQVYAARRCETDWQIAQVTDWVSRWDMQAQGSIPTVMDFGAITPYPGSSYLQLRVANKQVFGNMKQHLVLLDEQTLEPVTDPINLFPDLVSTPQSSIEGMRVNRLEWREEGRFFWYRWETLDAARDVVHDLEWIPKTHRLELVELTLSSDPLQHVGKRSPAGTGVIRKQRHRRLKAWLTELYNRQDTELVAISDLAKRDQVLEATSRLRIWVRQNVDFREDLANSKPISPAELDLAEEMSWHRFNWHGIRRELALEIGDWWPFPKSLWQEWTLKRRETDAYREAEQEELGHAFGPIWLWYQELHGWTHMMHLAKAYYSTKNMEYARQWVHDLLDWRYHNLQPEQPTAFGPWGLQVALTRLDRMIAMIHQLVEGEEISDAEFAVLLSCVAEHVKYVRRAIEIGNDGSIDNGQLHHLWIEVDRIDAKQLLQVTYRRCGGLI